MENTPLIEPSKNTRNSLIFVADAILFIILLNTLPLPLKPIRGWHC